MATPMLHHLPGSCSRVALAALEEIGQPYADKGLAPMRGARDPEFSRINPKNKAPTLVVDGEVVTELPVILLRLATMHPRARLLPTTSEGAVELCALSDLVWLAGAVHPLASRLFRPSAISMSDAEGVKANAIAQLGELTALIAPRLSDDRWWYGDTWSITDAFSGWIFSLAAMFGFSLADYPSIQAHRDRALARPAYRRAIEREKAAVERDALVLPAGFTL